MCVDQQTNRVAGRNGRRVATGRGEQAQSTEEYSACFAPAPLVPLPPALRAARPVFVRLRELRVLRVELRGLRGLRGLSGREGYYG